MSTRCLGLWLTGAMVIGACGAPLAPDAGVPRDASADLLDAPIEDASDASASCDVPGCPVTIESPIVLGLTHAPFPSDGHPDVAIHVPPRFDPDDRPGLIVFFHGFDNCVSVVISSKDAPCSAGGVTRTALRLAEQLDASGANAILMAIEIAYDQPSSDPGDLVIDGELRLIIDEAMSALDGPLRMALRTDDFERIVLASHSGGYLAVATCLEHAGIERIREVDLYDSLYGSIATYDAFVELDVARFDAARLATDGLRFVDVYTATGGTTASSQAIAARIAGWVDVGGIAGSLFYDDTTDTLEVSDYAHPLIVKRSGLTHDGVPRFYFEQLARASGFAARAP